MTDMPVTIDSLDTVMDRYRVLLCDVWGVVHDGVHAFDEGCAALASARLKGLAVVLVTNAPRRHGAVETQLAAIGVPADSFDRVVTSGDATRDLIRSGPRRIFHLGPDRDVSLYDGLDVELVEEFEASGVVCTGLFDDECEDPQTYHPMLQRLRSRDLPMVCANPDLFVERGTRHVWCAGALARDYAALGGRTLIAGKPHRPIYELALRRAGEVLGRPVASAEVLAIGDGILTDVKGAAQNGLDVLYVSGGMHAREYGGAEAPDTDLLASFLRRHGHSPLAVIPRLR